MDTYLARVSNLIKFASLPDLSCSSAALAERYGEKTPRLAPAMLKASPTVGLGQQVNELLAQTRSSYSFTPS